MNAMYQKGEHFGRFKKVYVTDLPRSDRFSPRSPKTSNMACRSSPTSPIKQPMNSLFRKRTSPIKKQRSPIAEKTKSLFTNVYNQQANNRQPLI